MRIALHEAELAGRRGEVPVGAVLVRRGEVLAARGNERELRHDPTAHAEVLVLRDSAALLGGWRLLDTTLYVTVEPCPMCAGALLLARVSEVVYGAADARGGAAGSVVDLLSAPGFNHRVSVRGGLLADQATGLLQSFFATRRGPAEAE
jgi:tRNA(adenine34) deaminase